MNETKSMGSFIAALRRSSGMTQKELADLLHVSDKAVSRWERDEASPDLSLLIPLSEILGVSVDELLRGERIRKENEESPAAVKRANASRSRLISMTLQTLRISSAGCILTALIGLLIAAICNHAFHRATLGFYLSCILHLIALFGLLIVGLVTMKHILTTDDENEITSARRSGLHAILFGVGAIITSFVFSLPLILLPFDPYMGITGETWLSHGLSYLLIAIPVQLLLFFLYRALGTWLEFYPYDPLYRLALSSLVRHLIRIVIIMLAALVAVDLTSSILLGSISVMDLAKGTEFDHYEAFLNHIESPLPGDQTEDSETDVDEIWSMDNQLLYTYRNPRNAKVLFTLTEDGGDVDSFYVYEETEWTRAEESYARIKACFEYAKIWIVCSCLAGYLIKRRRILIQLRNAYPV